MKYPEFLRDGGRIGFIAPSFGCSTYPYNERFNNALKHFNALGYKTVEGPNARLNAGIGKSNTPMACGAEINEFFLGDHSDVIISCGGGELMCEDLAYVDFAGIMKAAPKWYTGYSDNTNLTFLLPTICDIAAIYGPCVSDFGMEPWHKSVQDTFDLLCGKKRSFTNYDGWEKEGLEHDGDNPLAAYNITEPYSQRIYKADEAHFEGRLIGGCLDCLANLVGTRFDMVPAFNERYKDDGIIWFLESCDLNVMSMRRALWNLDEAGWFEHVKGFLIGRPLMHDDDFDGFKPYDAYTGILSKYNVPIIYDIDLGHLSPMIPMVSGGYAKVDASGNTFNIEMILR
ncbi:MAG: LD-carboxypeptidase [Lachnospiraceae bacterium]|nr:LD-carboxypeptidase [Lachnospiraceae bacterium]